MSNTVRYVTYQDWVKLAASTDEARPTLCGMLVDSTNMVATDGYRLHMAPVAGQGLAEGLWHVRRAGTIIDGKFPTYSYVVPDKHVTHVMGDIREVRAILAASIAYSKAKDGKHGHPFTSFKLADGKYFTVGASYLLDALKGADDAAHVEFTADNPLGAMRVDWDGRTAVLMAIRRDPTSKPVDRFDISDSLTIDTLAVATAKDKARDARRAA